MGVVLEENSISYNTNIKNKSQLPPENNNIPAPSLENCLNAVVINLKK